MAQGIMERTAQIAKLRRERTMRVPFVDLKAQYRTIRDDVQAAFDEVLTGMDFVLGSNLRAFEAEYAAYCQAKYAIGVANGTDALFLALTPIAAPPYSSASTRRWTATLRASASSA